MSFDNHNAAGNGKREGLKISEIGQSATKSNNEFIVYKITNTINGKAYIGITSRTAGARWSEHKKRAKEIFRNGRLYAAIRKYGQESFRIEIIAKASSDEEVRMLETRYILEYGTFESGYNSNIGGSGYLNMPDHIKIKIGAAQKGKFIPPESRQRMSDAKLGDPTCAINFGQHTQKGRLNPKSKSFRIRFPDGSEQVIRGMRAFCREHKLAECHLYIRGHSKGFRLLERLID